MRYLISLVASLSMLAQAGPFDGKSGPLVKAAYELLDNNQFNEAAAKFQEAAQADPKASYPISGLAKLFFTVSQHTDPTHHLEYRDRAVKLAHTALDLNDLDFIASEVLLNADGASAGSSHQPSPAALEAFNGAESAFQYQQWDEAAKGYQKALALDPAYTDAALYLGDTYFSQKRYEQAVPWFKKATEMEPRYGRAWRFLTDCYGHLDQWDDAMAADFGAIAGQPNDYTAWGRLREVYEGQRKISLIRFHFPSRKGSQARMGKNGDMNLSVDIDSLDGTPESTALLADSLASGLESKPEKGQPQKHSPFGKALRGWKGMMEVYENALAEKKAAPKDATWAQLLAFYRGDQLSPALMILDFHEAYRPDFEAWKAAHPKGVQAFIEQWHLRP